MEDTVPSWVTEALVSWTKNPENKGKLNLADRALEEIPPELYRMRNLEVICLAKNSLTTIPTEFSNLVDSHLLLSLDFSKNQISKITCKLSHFKTLESLTLYKNKLTSIPKSFGKLTNLKHLDMRWNKLKRMDPCLSTLVFLETLLLSHNQISSFSESIVQLGSLKFLNIGHNQISSIPPTIRQLRRLTTLRIDNNQLDKIPDEIGLLSLEEITINGNPLAEESEIREKQIYSCSSLCNFLRKRIRSKPQLRGLLFLEKDCEKNTRFESVADNTKPSLTAATIEKLVIFLTQIGSPDSSTLKALENCYSYFISPEELLRLLILRYQMSIGTQSGEVEELIHNRILYIFKIFVKKFNQDNVKYSEDFTQDMINITVLIGDKARSLLLEYCLNESVAPSQYGKFGFTEELIQKERARRLEKETEAKRQEDEELEQFLETNRKKILAQKPTKVKVDKAYAATLSSLSEKVRLLAFNSFDIAIQICKLNSEKFECIPRNEFLKQAWTKKDSKTRTPCITDCIENFNNLSNWCVTWIIRQTELKNRVIVLQHILDITNDLFTLGDYSGLFAIGSALSCAPVSRLKKTFAELDDKRDEILEKLNKLTDNTGNYKYYKELLALSVTSGLCVPHLAIYLKNLTFTEEGNSDYLEGTDMLNVEKFRFITSMLEEISAMQQRGYSKIADCDLSIRSLILMRSNRIDNSNRQYDFSLLCEASSRRSQQRDTGSLNHSIDDSQNHRGFDLLQNQTYTLYSGNKQFNVPESVKNGSCAKRKRRQSTDECTAGRSKTLDALALSTSGTRREKHRLPSHSVSSITLSGLDSSKRSRKSNPETNSPLLPESVEVALEPVTLRNPSRNIRPPKNSPTKDRSNTTPAEESPSMDSANRDKFRRKTEASPEIRERPKKMTLASSQLAPPKVKRRRKSGGQLKMSTGRTVNLSLSCADDGEEHALLREQLEQSLLMQKPETLEHILVASKAVSKRRKLKKAQQRITRTRSDSL